MALCYYRIANLKFQLHRLQLPSRYNVPDAEHTHSSITLTEPDITALIAKMSRHTSLD